MFLNPVKIWSFCGGKHSTQECFMASWRSSFNQLKGGRYGEWNSLAVMLLKLGHQRNSETLKWIGVWPFRLTLKFSNPVKILVCFGTKNYLSSFRNLKRKNLCKPISKSLNLAKIPACFGIKRWARPILALCFLGLPVGYTINGLSVSCRWRMGG